MTKKNQEQLTPKNKNSDCSDISEGEILEVSKKEIAGMLIQKELYSGPLPPAAEAERYEHLYPGTFEKLVALHERQVSMQEEHQTYRHEHQPKWREAAFKAKQSARHQGTFLLLCCIIGAIYLADNGNSWVATALLASPIMTVLIALFRK